MKITRGDYKIFKFQRKNAITGEIITQLPQELYFTVKETIYNKNVIFQKKLRNGITFDRNTHYYKIEILPEDTENLYYCDYFCDIQVNYSDTKKKTIYTGKFTTTSEVTFSENEVSSLNGEEVTIESINEEEITVISEGVTYVGGGTGTSNYEKLENLPSINGVELLGNKTTEELKIKTSDLINDSGFLTSVPTEYITETELNAKGYLTSVPEGYATESYVSEQIASAIGTALGGSY